jgi:hypothetical protein
MRAQEAEPDTIPQTPAVAGAQRAGRKAWIRLQQKTTLILVIMLACIVTSVGGIFFFSTRSMLQTSQISQVSTFAYGVAATLGNMDPGDNLIQIEFAALDKTPNLEFVVLTNVAGRQTAALISDHVAWNDYRQRINESASVMSTHLGQVLEVPHKSHRSSYAVTVPVFRLALKARRPASLDICTPLSPPTPWPHNCGSCRPLSFSPAWGSSYWPFRWPA